MASKPRLNRAQVRGLKRRIALRARLSNKALERKYGIGRKAIWEYATGVTPPLEDWTRVSARPGSVTEYGFARRTRARI